MKSTETEDSTGSNRDHDDSDSEHPREDEDDHQHDSSPVLNAFEKCLRVVFFFFVELIAELMAAIMSHPKVVDAAAQIVVEGMNKFGEQPDLSDRLNRMADAVLNEEQKKKTARQAGEDIPLYVSGFVGGLVSKIANKQPSDRNLDKSKKQKKDQRKSSAKFSLIKESSNPFVASPDKQKDI